ncbi:MAG: heme-binding protein [Gammaproteobacteria bacterium]
MERRTKLLAGALAIGVAGLSLLSGSVYAKNGHHDDDDDDGDHRKVCRGLPGHGALEAALDAAVATETSGLDFEMWATIVNRDGEVCAVAFSGGTGKKSERGLQWPGSRVISAQKANTANAFSLDGLALSTANLYSAVSPGGSLYGLQHSNPVDTKAAYGGQSKNNGQANDPMVGQKVGGVNVFGGGLGLYVVKGPNKRVVGGLGVSGDTSCADHMIAWRVRDNLGLDNLSGVGGVAALFNADPTHPDNIIYDITPQAGQQEGVSTSGFGHPTCLNTGDEALLPAVQ